jgi:hypothetical protein
MADWGRNMLWKKKENIYIYIYETELHCDANSDIVRETVQQDAYILHKWKIIFISKNSETYLKIYDPISWGTR